MRHIVTGHSKATAHHHDTAAEARECEEASTAYDMEPPSCPICDAWGCNGARGMGCDKYERGSERDHFESLQEEWAMAQGGFPF